MPSISRIIRFIKNWILPLAIVTGAASYIAYYNIPGIHSAGPFLESAVGILQPALLFLMLFLSFCRTNFSEMRLRRWHCFVLAFQCVGFIALSLLICLIPHGNARIFAEAAALCIICPTATAAAVITGKLGGNIAELSAYTFLANISASVLIPLAVPLIHPEEGLSFLRSFLMILGKVFPLLILPAIAAMLLRKTAPGFVRKLCSRPDLPFYLWAVSLSLAIAMTTKSIVHSDTGAECLAGIAAVSLASCAIQFHSGKKIGRRYGAEITAGQSLGQKNTVFAIWTGYSFLSPETSIAGGFYSIWHNIYNSWQLYRKRKSDETDKKL